MLEHEGWDMAKTKVITTILIVAIVVFGLSLSVIVQGALLRPGSGGGLLTPLDLSSFDIVFDTASSSIYYAGNGAQGAPSFTFSAEPTMGLHRQSAGVLDVDALTQIRFDINNQATILNFTAAGFIPQPDNTVDLGSGTLSFKDIYLAGALKRGATATISLPDATGTIFAYTSASSSDWDPPSLSPGEAATTSFSGLGLVNIGDYCIASFASSILPSEAPAVMNCWVDGTSTAVVTMTTPSSTIDYATSTVKIRVFDL